MVPNEHVCLRTPLLMTRHTTFYMTEPCGTGAEPRQALAKTEICLAEPHGTASGTVGFWREALSEIANSVRARLPFLNSKKSGRASGKLQRRGKSRLMVLEF